MTVFNYNDINLTRMPEEKYFIRGHSVVFYEKQHICLVDGKKIPSVTELLALYSRMHGLDDSNISPDVLLGELAKKRQEPQTERVKDGIPGTYGYGDYQSYDQSFSNISPEVIFRAQQLGKTLHLEIDQFEKKGRRGYSTEFNNYLSLKRRYNILVRSSELPVIIFDRLNNPVCQGRLDLLASINGQSCLCDIKRTSKIYRQKALLQLNLYRIGYIQTYGKDCNKLFVMRFLNSFCELKEFPVNENVAWSVLSECDKLINNYIERQRVGQEAELQRLARECQKHKSVVERLFFDENLHKYYLDGRLIPSITNVVEWYTQQYGHNDYSTVSQSILQRAAAKGIALHREIENYEKNNIQGYSSEFYNYLEIKDRHRISVQSSELPVIIFDESDNPICAGRIDLVASIDGQDALCDIKRTIRIYSQKTSLQLNMYRIGYLQSYGKVSNKLFVMRLREDVSEFVEFPVDEREARDVLDTFDESCKLGSIRQNRADTQQSSNAVNNSVQATNKPAAGSANVPDGGNNKTVGNDNAEDKEGLGCLLLFLVALIIMWLAKIV